MQRYSKRGTRPEDVNARLKAHGRPERFQAGDSVHIILDSFLDLADDAQATIARLTAERDQARAEAAAAYERAARVADGEVSRRSDQLQWPNHGEIQINRWQAGKLEAELISNKIRALATEPGTTLFAAGERACQALYRAQAAGLGATMQRIAA